MTHLTILLPEAAQAYIDEQIANGHYRTPDELFASLIEDARERQAKQKINVMLRSTLHKNKTIEATNDWWDEQRQYLTQQLPIQP